MATQLTPIRKADGGSPGAGPLSPPDSQCDPCKMDDFAELLCEFYELLVEMAYLPHGSIVYAPHTAVAPRITKREVVRQGLDPRIAPLIQKIPYIDVSISAQCDIIPNSVLVVYGIYQAMEDSRDPLRVNRDIGNTDAYLEKWVAPIFVSNSDGTGTNLLFDTRTGDVIVWKRVDPPSTFSPFRRPPFYYRDYPTLPATEYVAELIEEFRTLQLVPWNKVIIEPSDPLVCLSILLLPFLLSSISSTHPQLNPSDRTEHSFHTLNTSTNAAAGPNRSRSPDSAFSAIVSQSGWMHIMPNLIPLLTTATGLPISRRIARGCLRMRGSNGRKGGTLGFVVLKTKQSRGANKERDLMKGAGIKSRRNK
jgi:hypothetical protein